jgi:putative inorganic carbon (HCO3(-)) transporter
MAGDKRNPLPEKWGEQLPRIGRMPVYPQYSRLFILTFLAFMVFRNVDGSNRMDILASIRFEFLLGGTAVVMSIIKISGRPVRLERSNRIIIFIALLFFAMIIQLPMAADPAEAQRVFSDRAFKFALLTFLIAALVESPTTLKITVGAFIFSIFYITLEATRGLITGGLVWENQGIMRLHGAVPMYGHPNSLGGAALGTLPYVIFLFVPARRWMLRLILLVGAGTSMACVIYSGSRTAYVGLVTLFLWWFFQSRRKLRFMVVTAVVGVITLPLVPDQYVGRFQSIESGQDAEGHSTEARKLILRDAMTIFMENPLGIGVASFPAFRAARFGRSQDTHNLYLEVATNLGVQGLVIFIGLIWALLASFRRSALAFRSQHTKMIRLMRSRDLPPNAARHIHRHAQDLVFCLAAAQATAGFVVVRLTLGLFGMDLYEIYWWYAAGIAIALAGLVDSTNNKTRFLEQLEVAPEVGRK